MDRMYRRRDPHYKFKKFYLYLLGFGVMLFGVFAMLFRTYEHPLYGHIDFGRFHLWIGSAFIILSAVILRLIKHKF